MLTQLIVAAPNIRYRRKMQKHGGGFLNGPHRELQLADFGERICILGPSNSGKSTLAEAIARKQSLEVVHLDLLYHLPNTDWVVRPTDEFVALHDAAITGERWVIDGNYSKCMPQRFLRATGLILLDISTPASLFRYYRRTIFERQRVGALKGGQDSIKWGMIYHIAVVTPKNRKRYANMFYDIDLPKMRLTSIRAIKQCYQRWGLERQRSLFQLSSAGPGEQLQPNHPNQDQH